MNCKNKQNESGTKCKRPAAPGRVLCAQCAVAEEARWAAERAPAQMAAPVERNLSRAGTQSGGSYTDISEDCR